MLLRCQVASIHPFKQRLMSLFRRNGSKRGLLMGLSVLVLLCALWGNQAQAQRSMLPPPTEASSQRPTDVRRWLSIAALSIGTYAACQLLTFIWLAATAAIGTAIGAKVQSIIVGGGVVYPVRRFGSIEFCLGLLPAAGSVGFYRGEEKTERPAGESDWTPFLTLSPVSRIFAFLMAAVTQAAVATLLLAIALAMPNSGVVVEKTTNVVSTVKPSAVPGLTLTFKPATVETQTALFRDTFAEFFIRVVTFRSLDGWGASIGWII